MEWTEITQSNCDEVYKILDKGFKIVIAHKHREYDEEFNYIEEYITYEINHTMSIGTMAKYGGFYYIVLPKLL